MFDPPLWLLVLTTFSDARSVVVLLSAADLFAIRYTVGFVAI